MQDDSPTIAARYDALFGRGWRQALAAALEYKRVQTISEMFGAGKPQIAVVSAIEFLEIVPRSRWPQRWHGMRDLANAKTARMKPK